MNGKKPVFTAESVMLVNLDTNCKDEHTGKRDCSDNLKKIYLTKQDIRIYMLRIAGQTAGQIGLYFFQFFFPRATPSPSASILYEGPGVARGKKFKKKYF